MKSNKLNRRGFLAAVGGASSAVVLAACAPTPPAKPETITIKETVVVEKSVEKIVVATAPAVPDLGLTLKIGVVIPLTGDSAEPGQAWNEAVKVAVDYISETAESTGVSKQLKIVLSDSQDSEGSPVRGVEAAKKLVTVDGVQAIMGDFYSSVTSAFAKAVAIPNKVLVFTGGTNAKLTALNGAGATFLWQPCPADDLQATVLVAYMSKTFGETSKINIGYRNDAYAAGLATTFKESWEAQGGTIPQFVVYQPDQVTFDTEAQQLVADTPDGWLIVDFCEPFQKLRGPLERTGKWEGARTFGGDAMRGCGGGGDATSAESTPERRAKGVVGLRTTGANVSSGSSFADFEKLYIAKKSPKVNFLSFTAEIFDSVFVVYLAALAAKSIDTTEISRQVTAVTNAPAQEYDFTKLDQAMAALMRGEKIHFVGASGPLNFAAGGRVGAAIYDVDQTGADGVDVHIDLFEMAG